MTTDVLTNLDRCDRCGSQAYVKVTFKSGSELLMCGHHWSVNEKVLKALNVEVYSELHRLTKDS